MKCNGDLKTRCKSIIVQCFKFRLAHKTRCKSIIVECFKFRLAHKLLKFNLVYCQKNIVICIFGSCGLPKIALCVPRLQLSLNPSLWFILSHSFGLWSLKPNAVSIILLSPSHATQMMGKIVI